MPGRHSPRLYAIGIVIIILAPALILAVLLAINSARFERIQLEDSARDQTREATAIIERDVVAIENVLFALAGSPSLQTGELESFYDQAVKVSRQAGFMIVLRDAKLDRQVVNTAFPLGTSLADGTPAPRSAAEEALLRSGKPVVTDVFFGALVRQYVVSVAVPVFRGGDLQFLLSAGIPLTRFAELLGTLDVRAQQVINVIDRNGAFVTRSLKHDEYAGKKVSYPAPAAVQSVVTGVGRDGVASHWFVRESRLLRWKIATGVPDTVLQAPMTHALTRVAAAGSLLLVVAIGLAYVWGGRIAQSAGSLGIDRKPTREEFEILFDSSPNGVMVIDSQGRIALVNTQMETQFVYAREELIGKPVEILVPDSFRGAHSGLRRAFTLAPQARSMGAGRELYGRRKDGSEFPVEIGLNPISSKAGNLVMITVVDISRRKLAAERLTATTAERDDLRRRFINAQEQERLRLAHELHDQTGQSLTAALLEIKAIEDSFDGPHRERLQLLRAQLEQVGRTLHYVAWELRPASIDELGLSSALVNYLADWSEQSGIHADFHCGDGEIDDLSEEICTAIYRVVQEALTNVVKHARRATSVSVIIERTSDKLRLTIEDNGCGFDVDAATASKGGRNGGLGLAGMRERLTLIGAEFEVESTIGVGTTIFARIPLASQKAAA